MEGGAGFENDEASPAMRAAGGSDEISTGMVTDGVETEAGEHDGSPLPSPRVGVEGGTPSLTSEGQVVGTWSGVPSLACLAAGN